MVLETHPEGVGAGREGAHHGMYTPGFETSGLPSCQHVAVQALLCSSHFLKVTVIGSVISKSFAVGQVWLLA